MNLNTINVETDEPDAIIGLKDGYPVRVPVRRDRNGEAPSRRIAEVSEPGGVPSIEYAGQAYPLGGSAPELKSADFAQGINARAPEAPAIILSAHTYDCSHFGFRSATLNSDGVPAAVARAPDNSAGARDIEDFVANWRSKSARPAKVKFGPGVWAWDGLLLTENANPFYERSGLILEGAGSLATVLAATPSSRAQFLGIAGRSNWGEAPTLRGVRLYGAGSANPYQVGVFLNPEIVPDLGGIGSPFGGITGTHWDDVLIQGFAREQLWLNGGSEDTLIPIQYGLWKRVRCEAQNKNFHSFKLTGQVGPPWDFDCLEAYGTGATDAKVAYIGLDLRTGIPIASVSTATNALTFAEPHRFRSGSRFRITGGTAWAGLSLDTDYFAWRLDDFRIRVCATKAQAYAAAPTFVTLTSATGTATASSRQVNGVQQGAIQVIFRTPTFMSGQIGLEVQNAALVQLHDLHCEETVSAVKTGPLGRVSVHGGSFGNAAKTSSGVLFDASEGGEIQRHGLIVIEGECTKLATSWFGTNVDDRSVDYAGAYYPTTGAGVSGKSFGFRQLANGAEIDVGQRCDGEYLLNTGTTVFQHIRGQRWRRAVFRLFPQSGEWAEFGVTGNLNLQGRAYLAGGGGALTMRIPSGSILTLREDGNSSGANIESLELPVHAGGAWALGTGNLAAGATATTTVTCPGARVGDLRPMVGLSAVPNAALRLHAEVTATDTVTVTLWNPTAGGVALPGTVTPYVRQVR